MKDEVIAYHLIISGKVQGVFYRKSAAKKAMQLALVGWVQNKTDGSVEIEVQGGINDVKEFIDWCTKGPEYAIVEGIQQQQIEHKSHSQFRIIR